MDAVINVFLAREIGDIDGWFVVSRELAENYCKSPEHTTTEGYMCFHCGILVKESQVIVHKDSCMIGADERLNKSLFMLEYCFDTANTNDGLGSRVFSDVSDFIRSYK